MSAKPKSLHNMNLAELESWLQERQCDALLMKAKWELLADIVAKMPNDYDAHEATARVTLSAADARRFIEILDADDVPPALQTAIDRRKAREAQQ